VLDVSRRKIGLENIQSARAKVREGTIVDGEEEAVTVTGTRQFSKET